MSVFRTIVRAFKSEFGTRRLNPWPRCGSCFRRIALSDFCTDNTHVQNTCFGCCVHAGHHP